MKTNQIILVVILGLTLIAPMLLMSSPNYNNELDSPSHNDGTYYEMDDGSVIPIGPDEELHRYILTEQGWMEWTGISNELSGGEYGNRSDSFNDLQMKYFTSNTTTTTSVEVPTGTDWESYYVRADVSDLTENRTWVQNPDFEGGDTGWTMGSVGNGSGDGIVNYYWLDDGHGSNDDCVYFEADSTSGGPTYWYNADDRVYLRQTMNIARGDVVWSAFRLDYWADTMDDTHYGMTGSFSIYLELESTRVWELVFDAIGAEETWYDTGLVSIPTSVYDLPSDQNVLLEFGLHSLESVGYSPNINPAARMDNIEVYVKTKASPTNVNLEMNGNSVSSNPGYGTGFITESPSPGWVTDPVKLNFTWAPTPINPDPNREIWVDFSVTTNLFARRTSVQSVYEINPTSFGERFRIENGTAASYTTYHHANIPDGYANRYFYNLTTPINRDVFFVARPLAPSTNLTSGWTGGQTGDEYVNVSAYDVTTEAGRYGYWRIQSSSPNMISDLELYDPDTLNWVSTVSLRAGNDTRVRAFVGSSFSGSIINITIYDPSGAKWYSVNATADGSGYATSPYFNLAGSNASAGSWMVQAICNDVGTNGDWTSTGFFKRPFSVIHQSDLSLTYPTEAVGTGLANVTFGDLLLVIFEVEDIDSNVLVAGGTLELDWVLGKELFDDSGNGQYTKVLDTSLLPGKGQYLLDFEWSHTSLDNSTAQLILNVNYAAELTSPEYPGISGPVDVNQTFSVDFKNVNGTGITGGNIWCNWSGPYDVTPIGGGSYEFELDTAGFPLGEYPILINATASFVEPASMLLYMEIREIYNTVAISANQLSIPVGEADSFILTWTDTDTGLPIQGGASYIVCNWTDFHSSGEQNYTVVEIAAGEYNVTLYTEDDDPLTAADEFYTVLFTVERFNYQNHTFEIGVQVRSHNTLFILDEPIEQTLIGDTITVLVYYADTDLNEGIVNVSGNVQLTISTPDLPSLSYVIGTSSYGDGHYNISIPSAQWGNIGWKNLTLQIEWTGGVLKYYNGTIETSVRILGTDTDLFLELAPAATYYLNEFVFTAVYWDAINSTRVSNTTNHVFVQITPLTGGHPVTQSDFTITELGGNPGTYEFRVNTTDFQDIGTFRFELAFMWEKGQSPYYENKTMTFTLVVLERPTYVDFTPIPSTPYGELAEFSFTYIDTLSNSEIENSSSLDITILEGGVDYTLAYNSLDKTFQMSINTSSLGGTGTFTLHLSFDWTGEPFYSDIASQAFLVTVTLRATQLSHLPFTPGQWGNNVTIEFIYLDAVAGSSSGMVGILSLNASLAGWYSVTDLMNGHYLVTLNMSAFPSDGSFTINASIVYTGSNFAADAIDIFGFTVLKRVTQLGFDTPDPAPYQSNVTFTISYIDDTTAVGILGASVSVSCSNASQALVLNTNYWISEIGSGQYEIHVSTVALGDVGVFILSVSVSKAGAPFYLPATRDVTSRVTQRTTQILITQTPGDVPFLENVTFQFVFQDFLTGNDITIDKSHITLSHGIGMIVIGNSEYALVDYSTYYEISFNSTTLNPSALVTGHSIQLLIDKSVGAPFYSPRGISTLATTVERPTQVFFPLVEATPYTDNITIELDFVDFISGLGIDGALVDVDSLNLTSPLFYTTSLGSGSYRLLVPSLQFGDTGTIYITISLGWSGSPFYADRSVTDVPVEIKLIQTSLLSEAPAPGSTVVGIPIIVNLTLIDFDHDIPITGASISTDWTSLYGTDYDIQELGNGQYSVTLNMTGLTAQAYPFNIQAQKQFFETASIVVSVQPGAQTVEIVMAQTAYYADWGEIVPVMFGVQEPFYGTYVPGMNATLLWNGTLYTVFTDLGNGSYIFNIDTSDNNFGIFEPLITVSRQYYQTRQRSFTMVVSKATGQVVSEQSTFDVVIETVQQFWIYLNDTVSNGPVVGGSVNMEWNNTPFALVYNGTPGFFEGEVNVSGFAIGTYELVVRGIAENFVFLDITIDINVVPIPTFIQLADGSSSKNIYYGDSLSLLVMYNDTYHGGTVSEANVSFTLGNLTGLLMQEANGTYSVTIDTSSLAAQTIYLRLSGSKTDYASALKTIIVTIQTIPTDISVDIVTQSGYTGDTVSFTFTLTETLTDSPILGATLDIDWEGSQVVVTDHQNGSYTVTVTINQTLPGLYELTISLSKINYNLAAMSTNVIMLPTPAHIEGVTSVQVPINGTTQVFFTVINDLTQGTISDINGFANLLTIEETPLQVNVNGSYYYQVPADLPIGIYDIDINYPTDVYTITPLRLELVVRQVLTELRFANSTINTAPGNLITLEISYWDLDNDIGISGVTPEVLFESTDISYNALQTTEENGHYRMFFVVQGARTFQITITFQKEDYETRIQIFTIVSDLTEGQVLAQQVTVVGGLGLIFLAVLLVAYVRIYSVPKLVRIMNKMIKAMVKGRIPDRAEVPTRKEMVITIINEEIKASGIVKGDDDVVGPSIEAIIPEVNDLIDRLAEITGLGPEEIEAFRTDLARMKASERPGFIREVIEQEEARRAETLEEAKPTEEVSEKITLDELPEEMEELRLKLQQKGMAAEEIEIILEQARGLSKADLEALLSSLGIDLG